MKHFVIAYFFNIPKEGVGRQNQTASDFACHFLIALVIALFPLIQHA